MLQRGLALSVTVCHVTPSSEGIAQHLHGVFDRLVLRQTDNRAIVLGSQAFEIAKNLPLTFRISVSPHLSCVTLTTQSLDEYLGQPGSSIPPDRRIWSRAGGRSPTPLSRSRLP